jgi:hypothetical protein
LVLLFGSVVLADEDIVVVVVVVVVVVDYSREWEWAGVANDDWFGRRNQQHKCAVELEERLEGEAEADEEAEGADVS